MLKSVIISINVCPNTLLEFLNSRTYRLLTKFFPCFSQMPVKSYLSRTFILLTLCSNIDQIPKCMGFRSGIFRGQLIQKVTSSTKFLPKKLSSFRHGNGTIDQLNCVNANISVYHWICSKLLTLELAYP